MRISMLELRGALLSNVRAQIPTMIWGPPGVGKSDESRAVAKELGWGYIDFRATLREPVDMRGLPIHDNKTGTTIWLPPDELPNAKRDGKNGLLVLEELPQATDAMQKSCFSLALERYIGEYKLPDGWSIVANGNRRQDRSGASRMLTALANRFAHFEVEADPESWYAWASKADLAALKVEPQNMMMVEAFLRMRPEYLHKMPVNEEVSFPTPRAWVQVAKVCGAKDDRVRFASVAALVGEVAAQEFEAYIRVFSRLPSLDSIFKDPMSVHVPSMAEPALLHALVCGMARRVDKAKMANAFKYAKRLPVEFQTAFAVGAARRDASLKETKAFGDWYANNSEVLI